VSKCPRVPAHLAPHWLQPLSREAVSVTRALTGCCMSQGSRGRTERSEGTRSCPPGPLHQDKCPLSKTDPCREATGSSWSALGSQEQRAREQTRVSPTPVDLVFVGLVCTYIFTLAFKEKCQGKRERMSDRGARHLGTGSPAIAPCLARTQWATFFLLSPLFLKKIGAGA